MQIMYCELSKKRFNVLAFRVCEHKGVRTLQSSEIQLVFKFSLRASAAASDDTS